jgi:succinate--hydroxymethylglutarate CoA-transferase
VLCFFLFCFCFGFQFKHPDGKAIIEKLAKKSDVVLENFMPGKLDALGLGYDALCKVNPAIIYASITGYGPDGPSAHQAGYDVIIEGEAGLMHITGESDGRPVKVGHFE